jgi:FkbH-like protein
MNQTTDSKGQMRVTQQQVLDFARWTGDCNPIHVDPVAAKESAFGGTICHGMLVLIESFAHWDLPIDRFPKPLHSLQVQFRSEVRPDTSSKNLFVMMDSGLTGKLSSNDSLQLELTAQWLEDDSKNSTSPLDQRFSWMQAAKSSGIATSVNTQPQPWTTDEFQKGHETLGVHRFGHHLPSDSSKLSQVQEQVFGLCSFIVGMRVPGLSSLFTRLKAEFVSDSPATEELLYRLTLQSYDENFRFLEMQLDVATGDMQPVACCQIECYVRFPKPEPRLETYDGIVPDSASQSMAGKISLVCGASRGLGADIAAALASAGSITYLASRSRSKTTDDLVAQIQQRGGQVHVLLGNVGDPNWCTRTAELIEQTHGRLDHLVLNACELPELKVLADTDPMASASYIQRNIALYQQPLMHFLGLIKRSEGTVAAISSSAVEEIPFGFGDYVSVKLALEGAIRTVARENPGLRGLIVRPPQLQTAWNDTPIRAVGSVSVQAVASEILIQISQEPWDKNLKVITKFPNRRNAKKKLVAEAELVLVASFTLDPIHRGFEGWSEILDTGIQPKIAPYAQILQQALDPTSYASKSPTGSVFLVRTEDWFHELPPESLKSASLIREVLKNRVSELIDAIKSHRVMAKGPTLFLLCPSFVDQGVLPLFVEAERDLEDAIKGLAGLTFWRADAFHACYGLNDLEFQDPLRNTIGHIPYIDPYYDYLATLCIRYMQRKLEAPKKVVVLDCDNTLWRGVVGELGPQGITFDPVHHRLHRKLAELAESGMLLCLCSKNEPEDVWAVFDQRSDFGLRRDQFVASKINWMPKGHNIQDLAKSLNLGLDSFVFLDDNPVECAEVRATCPSVLTLQWYQENALADLLIDHLWELDIHSTTKEDRERTRMYRDEFQRQEVQANAANFQTFIESLQLKLDFTEVTDEYLQRAAQLTLRTNQFNFTTIRRNESEILQLQQNPDVDMRIVQVQDRFGDYGIVGLFVAKSEPSGYSVDTFLLSCRVLGRGVEHRIASHIANLAAQRGHEQVRWIYKPTEKNAPAKLFLQKIASDTTLEAKPTELSVAVDQLRNIKFQADRAPEPIDDSNPKEPKPKKESRSTKKRSVRVREEQIRSIVEELSHWSRISERFRKVSPLGHSISTPDLDVQTQVLGTFSKVLGIEEERIKSVDRLDALGCDSLQIVGITVALTKVFPELPPTLLFEYRSVSEIIEQLTRLCNPSHDVSVAAAFDPSAATHRQPFRSKQMDSEIAIVGIGVQCAAGNGLDRFWSCLLRKESMVVPLPKHRDGYVGQLAHQHPYFASMMPDVTSFDPEFFGVSPREAQYMDPQMRMVLQSAWHSLEDAGFWSAGFDQTMGVFVGIMYQCYGRLANQIATQNASVYRCWEGFGVANRLSQILGVSGPSLAIDTACSSSATALHYAVESLRNNECGSALVSGVNLILDPARIAQLDNLGILTRTGQCVPFGDLADGTVIGEGAVAIVIKRLSDALKDSDRIYAVIKGTGVSVGAGSVGFTAPNPVAQSLAIRSALLDARIDPRTIGYVETHGTGTQLGDPIEVRGLEMAYCDKSLWDQDLQCQAHTGIGSIKPNIGHLEAGAGLVGVVKAALQLHHKTLLPSITSDRPNPQIHFDQLPFKIQTKAEDWKPVEIIRKSTQSSESLPRRAAVNSFGVGGSNAHIILEESPTLPAKRSATERSAHLLTLQAANPEALRLQAKRWSQFLQNQSKETIGNALYSNLVGRKNFEFKLALPVEDIQAAASQLGRWSNSDTESSDSESTDTQILCGNALWKKSNRIAYLFTGQGAQYPGMLRQLYEQSPVFQQAIEQCSGELDPKLEKPIRSILFDSDDSADPLIHQTQYTQPAIFIAQYGLFKLWESYGVQPDYVLGHSIGEIAAYCATGGCSLADALKLVHARGALMQRLNSGGGMTSVAASAQRVEAIFAESRADLSIAAYNGPNQTVISGSLEQIAKFVDKAQAAGIKTQALKVSHAFHSKRMEPMLEEFRAVVAGLKLGVPKVEFISTVTASAAEKELASADYWVDQVRQPVRFMQAMETLASKTVSHYIEIGPHPVLTTMSRSIELPNTDDSTRWLSSVRRGHSDWSVLLASVGQLFVDGYPIDWKNAEAFYPRHRVSVPGYEFSNRRIWLDEMDTLVGSYEEFAPAIIQTHNQSTEDRHLYQVRWRRSGDLERTLAVNSRKDLLPKHWLILGLGDASLGKSLESQLQSDNGSVRRIQWNPLEANWGLQPSDCAGVDRIVLAVGDGAQTLGTAAEVQQVCESRIDAFSKALSMLPGAQTNKAFWLMTQGAKLVDQKPVLSPIDATLWGGAKVASIELPEVWGGAIDAQDSPDAIRRAIQWIQGDCSEDQVILIDDGVWVPRLESLSIAPEHPETQATRLGQRVLITGGLGSIGMRLAEYAVSQGVKEFVLVGRSMQPTVDQQQKLDRWKTLGVSVQLLAADVSSQEGIARLTSSLEGKQIDSILHTAGVDFLSPIAKWTTDDVHRVTQAKIQGAWNLHQWSLSHPIKQFVLTSSIASVWGAPDRFLYASANAFLDALGDYRVTQKLPVTVLNFGPWAEGGMADQKSLDEYRRVGMHGLEPSQTIASIGRLLQQGVTHAVITDTQWDRFASVMSARRPRPFFESLLDDPSVSAASSAQVDRTGTRAVTRSAGAADDPWLAQLSGLDQGEQVSQIRRLVRKALSEVLKSQEDRISLDRNMYRLGLDSITAVELSMKLKKLTGIAAGKWLAGEPTVESVAAGLLDGLQSRLVSVAQVARESRTGVPKSTTGIGREIDKYPAAPWASELLSLASHEQKRERLFDLFGRELERFAGKSGSKISGSTRMADLGLDSLGVVDFSTHVRKQLGLNAPPRLMQYATLGDWVSTVIPSSQDEETTVGLKENPATGSEGVRLELYESAMHKQVIEFCKQAWPSRSLDSIEQRWDWMYLKSAERLGAKPTVWLAKDQGKLIGHMGSQFTTLKTPRGEIVLPWFVDTMVLEQYRQKGIGSQVLLQAEEDMPIALSLGQTAEIRRILDSLGWKQICPLHIHTFMVRPDRVLRGKLPMGIDRVAAAYFALRGPRRKALQASRSNDLEVRRVDRFHSSHDALWEQMRQGVSCLAVRDSSYLNWKYADQPGQRFECWEVLRANRLLGVFVTKTEEPNANYAYRRVNWVDMVCAMNPETIDTVIQGCICSSVKLGADAISIQLTHRLIEERLIGQGFLARQETRYLYASRGLTESVPGIVDYDWLINQGDSDIDRPE